MNDDLKLLLPAEARRHAADGGSPILIVPYMWIGDFVRCHSVVTLLRQRFPDRPVDMLATTLCAPLGDYMPGLRQTIIADLPRGRLALSQQAALAGRLKAEGYGMALMMPRTWKCTLAPFLAGIPRAYRLFRRGASCRSQRRAFRRTQTAAHGGSVCHACAAAWRRTAFDMANAHAEGACGRGRGVAEPLRLDGGRSPSRGAGPGRCRTLKTLAQRRLCRPHPPPDDRRLRCLGAGRSR